MTVTIPVRISDELVDSVHDAGHSPPDDAASESFQESLALTWVDPIAKAAGWHHFGLQYSRDVADVNSYLSHRSVVVGRDERLTAPVATGDFTETISVGGISRTTLELAGPR
ncbi:hypothetical protein KUG88_25210 [Rhodococcus rhodochrous]|uniref:hypothetical protein n=1 Tax=Rhodococcus rhodochrous TaxID=1829 RepID=UPI001E35F165|nr:hypothetical protein [Rhodococcus rhodochrous]MCB8913422.1 hypothetical protein [Rhodococcus rhodochrous]